MTKRGSTRSSSDAATTDRRSVSADIAPRRGACVKPWEKRPRGSPGPMPASAPHRVAREAVLTAFGPRRHAWRVRRTPPRILVATDVAAEGLDLHAAGRIVHVDLPWTATRLEQREGRLVRLGQEHRQVEVIVRLPAAAIERAFASHARVRRKRRLANVWLARTGKRRPRCPACQRGVRSSRLSRTTASRSPWLQCGCSATRALES